MKRPAHANATIDMMINMRSNINTDFSGTESFQTATYSVWNAVLAGLLACNAVCSLKGDAVSHERVVRNYKTIPLIIASSACCKHVISLCTWHCWLGKPTTVGLGDHEHLSMVGSACMAAFCRAFAWFPMALFLALCFWSSLMANYLRAN